MTRAEARALDMPKYFTGRPCPHGHTAERWTSTCCCVPCTAARHDSWRYENRSRLLPERRARYAENPEPHRARRVASYWAAPEKGCRATRAYRSANPAKAKASVEKYQKANPGKKRANKARWDRANKIRRSTYDRDRRKAHPDKERAKQINRRARILTAKGTHSAEDIAWLWEVQRGRCAHPWCRAKLTRKSLARGKKADPVDHIIPLAKGGSNDRRNLQLLCQPCNSAKGAKHPSDFAQQHGMLL